MGNLIFLGNTPVFWRSVQMQSIQLSSCESEYVAQSEACRELVYEQALLLELLENCCYKDVFVCLDNFVLNLRKTLDDPLLLKIDNKGAKAMSETPETKKSKHIQIRHHYVRQLNLQRLVTLEYVKSEENKSDFLTKQL